MATMKFAVLQTLSEGSTKGCLCFRSVCGCGGEALIRMDLRAVLIKVPRMSHVLTLVQASLLPFLSTGTLIHVTLEFAGVW